MSQQTAEAASSALSQQPIAIIGLGCLFPGAEDPKRYWSNILGRVDAITEVPPSHWRPEDYFDRDPRQPDHTYAVRGGFLSPVDFPPLEFGITPNTLEAIDTTQLLGLLVGRQALDDAGYGPGRDFDRNRVSVILGITGTLPLVIPLGARLGHPIWRKALREAGVPEEIAHDVMDRIAEGYVGWQEDSFPGLLGNVVAGRIANRLDLGGTNCVVDAACASSLSALHLALMELASGRCDMALTGGMDTFNDIFMYMCFSKTPALSPTGNAKPFDAGADGTILGEGIGCLVLKRLADAERDGDRIYAVIRGIGTSSDGKGHAIYAPSPAGQMKALRLAYRLAGITPETIELVEAHGTGTKAGDTAEVSALTEVYTPFGRALKTSEAVSCPWVALGSVKSQIGHTKAAAGAAGLIKATLALHHKVLPPTIKVEQPIEPLAPGRSPFYVNTEKRPWLPHPEHPRRAAVSSFGFGGSNFHCVLEEYRPTKPAIDWDGQVQVVAFSAPDRNGLDEKLASWPANASWDEIRTRAAQDRAQFQSSDPCRLVLVLERDRSDPARLVATARSLLAKYADRQRWTSPEGICFGSGHPAGKLALVFPGQGSQYTGMLRDLACQFPQMLDVLADANGAAEDEPRLTDRIYPQPAFGEEERLKNEELLRATDVAQPALGAVSLGAFRVLEHFGVRPDAVTGHSYGELVALHVAGCFDAARLHQLSRLRGRFMADGTGDRGAMLAVRTRLDQLQAILREEKLDLVIANKNAPQQLVLSGSSGIIDRAAEALERRSVQTKRLPVAAAFHSSHVAQARDRLAAAIEPMTFSAPRIPVFANTTGQEYPRETPFLKSLLARQLAEPVEFVQVIENMYRSGVRTFLEVGPGNKLCGLIDAILEGREHDVLAVDASGGKRSGQADLARVLALLAASGLPVRLSLWDEPAANRPAAVEKKPTLTVRLSGANYVKPKPARPPRKNEAVRQPASNPSPAIAPAPIPGPPQVERKPAMTVTSPVSRPVGGSVLDQSLRMTQESLLALQKLGEQTAQLHRQFLDGQDRALQVMQTLLQQQQQLIQASLGLAPAALPGPVAAALTPAPEARRSAEPRSVPQPNAADAPTLSAPSVPPKVEAAPAPTPAADGRAKSVLLEVVSEKTGYPAEMLELDMELDSDLGIDSIKRVEIFSSLQEKLPEAPAVKAEHLGTLRTLRQVVEFLGSTPAPAWAESPPAKSVTATAPTSPGADRTRKMLLDVVSEKTGYPAEMLELDMELDSDLGIDSIKRVEIFSSLQEKLPEAPAVKAEHLGTLRTLRQVVEFLANGSSAILRAGGDLPIPTAPQEEQAVRPDPELHRYVLTPVPLNDASDRKPVPLPADGEIWVTEDGSALAASIIGRLSVLGYRPRLVNLDPMPVPPSAELAGLVIVAPSARSDDSFLKQAFRLAQTAGPALREAGRQGAAVLVTVSRLDGAFGLVGLDSACQPMTGGLAGLAKTARHEWPEVHCKAIDLAPSWEDPDEAGLAIVEEMLAASPIEVGLSPRGRCRLELVETRLSSTANMPLAPGDVVLITGGARGVTAETAVALSRACHPTLVLLGRSPAPSPEPAWLTPLRDEAEIKRAILNQAGGKLTPREVADRFAGLTANQEVLRNVRRIEEAGARVVYRQVDIRDAAAVRAVVQSIRGQLGPIKGLIHGAGVLADRLIADKTPEQFEQVHDTKVAGLQSLLRTLELDSLKVVALFSSTTARLGRAGQVDYAMANEALNKLAHLEARGRPDCRVVSVNWGPWDGGMVTPALKRLFESEGVGVIPLAAGASYLVQEISQPAKSPVEVVVMAGTGLPSTDTAPATDAALTVAFERDLSVEEVPVLRAHVLDGRAVLPMALTIEWLAHAALHGNPGLVFQGFDDLRILKGVTLERNETLRLRVLAGKARKKESFFLVPVEMRSEKEGRSILHARASIVLANRLTTADGGAPDIRTQAYPHSRTEFYRDCLFHGPELQGIERIEGCSEQGMLGTASPAPAPPAWLRQPPRQAWLADPLVLDCAFQMMILWTLETQGVRSLPTFVGRYRQYRRSFPRESVRIHVQVEEHTPHRARATIIFTDQAGSVIARIEDYECVIDVALDRAFAQNQFARHREPVCERQATSRGT